MDYVIVENQTHPLPAPLVAKYCSSFGCRLRGLMFRKILPDSEGLLLVDKRDSKVDASIHMMFVNFDLAVIWINHQGDVVDTVLARSWRPAYFPKQPAQYILELSAARLGEFKVGDHIVFTEAILDR